MKKKFCPKCGYPLDLNGLCHICGYKAPFRLDDIFFDNEENPWHTPQDD